MKTLLIALTLFTGLFAFAPQAEAKSKRVAVVNNYYGGYAQPRYSGYGGRDYRYRSRGYYRPSYYQPVYYNSGYYGSGYRSGYYRDSYCAPRYYSRPRIAVSFGF